MKNNNQTFLILFAVLLSHFYSFGQDENVVFENFKMLEIHDFKNIGKKGPNTLTIRLINSWES